MPATLADVDDTLNQRGDPWGQPFEYIPGFDGRYELRSPGKDRVPGTSDDIRLRGSADEPLVSVDDPAP